MGDGKMRLGLAMRGLGYHPGAWRHPDVLADGASRLDHYRRTIQAGERGKIDMAFFADGNGIRSHDRPKGALARMGTDTVDMDPLTLLAALSQHTGHIGLIATASTAYNEPFSIARRFATLDLLSGGRAGWNVVASWSDEEARNFGRDRPMDYGRRYARCAEFADVVTGLWDSWEPDALTYDKESGLYFDEAGMHRLNHRGEIFGVQGPLNVAPSPQGRPVVVQAGDSAAGREIGARHADVVYTMPDTLEKARTYAEDMHSRLAAHGREPDDLKIMPAIRFYVAPTRAEAQEKYELLQSLVDPLVGLSRIYSAFGDLSAYSPDDPIPLDISGPDEMKSLSNQMLEQVRKDRPTIREYYLRVVGEGSLSVIGIAADVADVMEEWFRAGVCAGFNLNPPALPVSVDDFVDMVIPELRRRGLFREEYEGRTLRENLGLRPHVNRHAQARLAAE